MVKLSQSPTLGNTLEKLVRLCLVRVKANGGFIDNGGFVDSPCQEGTDEIYGQAAFQTNLLFVPAQLHFSHHYFDWLGSHRFLCCKLDIECERFVTYVLLA